MAMHGAADSGRATRRPAAPSRRRAVFRTVRARSLCQRWFSPQRARARAVGRRDRGAGVAAVAGPTAAMRSPRGRAPAFRQQAGKERCRRSSTVNEASSTAAVGGLMGVPLMTARSRRAFAGKAEQTARPERAIQEKVDRADKAAGKSKGKKSEAMQAGARAYPTSFPKQHLKKPGLESELAVQPMYEAPQYRGSDKLRDIVALITGGDSGIGRAVAVLYAREGADVAITYLNEHGDAETTKRAVEAEGRRCITMAGDVADLRFCEAAVEQTIDEFGKLDILV